MNKIFELTNRYIVTATPLILFTLLSSVYFALSLNNARLINILISILIVILMTAAFMGGWFKMIKDAAEDNQVNEPNAIIKDFVPGVGEYFLTMLGSMGVILLLNIVILIISYYLGMKFIGNPQISAEAFSKALVNTETLKQFLSTLSSDQLVKISFWNILLLVSMALNWFLVMFYMPAIFYNSKNPVRAYFISLKNLFSRKIFKNTGIYLLIFVVYFTISIMSALFANNFVMNFIMTLVNFYFICLVAIGIFYYYNKTFVELQLGKNVDTYI